MEKEKKKTFQRKKKIELENLMKSVEWLYKNIA